MSESNLTDFLLLPKLKLSRFEQGTTRQADLNKRFIDGPKESLKVSQIYGAVGLYKIIWIRNNLEDEFWRITFKRLPRR